MFGAEIITRKCVLTLEGDYKVVAELSIPNPHKPFSPDEMERRFVENFNKSQPFAKNKAVSVHILRN